MAPIVLIAGLGLAGGGFDVTDRHIAALGAWLLVVALIVLGAGARAVPARPLYWSVGLLAALAVLSGLSSLWSGAAELSFVEADRVLAYLGFFLAAFLIVQTDQRRQRFAEGLAISIAILALLGLGSRLLPELVDVAGSLGSGPRMTYPLGYWNANGAIFGIGVALLLWLNRRSASSIVRWVAVGVLPALLLALYFTYSRGGLLALAIAVGVLLALSRDRLWLLATLGVGALGALPAVLAVQARRSLADNYFSQVTVDQGAEVLAILVAGTALAMALFAVLRWAERREGRLTGRALELSRDPRLLRGLAAAGAVLAIGVAIAVGGRAWDRFSSSDVQFPSKPEAHFSEFGGAGRHDFFRVALDSLGEDPLLGSGAGTYQFAWERQRSIAQPVHDAHSLYFEAFAELGIVGGCLVLALVGFLLWTGYAAWRDSPHPRRERNAALLAAIVAFAVVAGLDWFWEVAALGAVFFAAAALLVAERCRQLGPLRSAARDEGNRSFALAATSLAAAWIAAIALIGPLLVEHEIDASQGAAARGDFGDAVNHALNARSIEPFAASPYVQLGLLAEAQRDYATARERLTQAIDREDRNWQLYYLRSRVEEEAGARAEARADLEHARRLNPLEQCLRGSPDC